MLTQPLSPIKEKKGLPFVVTLGRYAPAPQVGTVAAGVFRYLARARDWKRYFPEKRASGADNREKAFLAAPAHFTNRKNRKGPTRKGQSLTERVIIPHPPDQAILPAPCFSMAYDLIS